jgi:hypothetical protein
MLPFSSRCRWIVRVAIVLGLVVVPGLSGTVRGDVPDTAQIKQILRTADPQEDHFVDRVAAMVKAGTLPEDLFQSTFLWARKKPKHKFQYFKNALITRAADAGITVK